MNHVERILFFGGREWFLYRPYIEIRWIEGDGVGLLQMPHWRKWWLGIVIDKDMTCEKLKRGIWLQNMVAGVWSHGQGVQGCYYETVEQIEEFLGCGRLC